MGSALLYCVLCIRTYTVGKLLRVERHHLLLYLFPLAQLEARTCRQARNEPVFMEKTGNPDWVWAFADRPKQSDSDRADLVTYRVARSEFLGLRWMDEWMDGWRFEV